MFIKPQNGPTLCEHVTLDPHIVLDETPPTFIHHFTPKGITFPFEYFNPMDGPSLFLGCQSN